MLFLLLCNVRDQTSLGVKEVKMYTLYTFPLPSGLLVDSEGASGVEVSNTFFGTVLVVEAVVLDLFEVVVVVSDWLDLKDDCCMSRIDPKLMVTGLSVLLSSYSVSVVFFIMDM